MSTNPLNQSSIVKSVPEAVLLISDFVLILYIINCAFSVLLTVILVYVDTSVFVL